MPEIIVLDEVNMPAAVQLVARGIGEIPIYQWLLGEHIEDQSKREWLADILMRPLQRVGSALGARDGDRLVAVLVWQPHDIVTSPEGRPALTPDDIAVAIATPGLRERLLELWTSDLLPRPEPDAVNCVLAVVDPDFRGGRVLVDMIGTVEDFCREHNRPMFCWTGSERTRDWFRDGWNLTLFATNEWNGRRMYGLVSDRPPGRGATA